ncbi:hypothetical protein GD429_04180 [Burkholderia sp. BE17]|nr:hypothetical protein [Burkholderia sp. BE17]MPV65087.1 hypothetical protein [Burkholderia sp. BE17]
MSFASLGLIEPLLCNLRAAITRQPRRCRPRKPKKPKVPQAAPVAKQAPGKKPHTQGGEGKRKSAAL